MDIGHTPTWLATLPLRQQAFDEISMMVAGDPDLKPLKLLEVLKVGNGRQVFLVKWKGEKAVLKRFLADGEAPPFVTVENLQNELDHLAPRMNSGPYQINQCLVARPDLGFAVLSYAKGKRITDVLSASNPNKRARLVRESGKWLAHYTLDRRRKTTFGPRHWVERREAVSKAGVSRDDQQLLDELLRTLNGWVSRVQGCSVTQAAIHGDYSGLNLHIQAGTLTGVDVQGECWQALSRDVARFLVWQQIRDTAELPSEIYGINEPDWQAFLSSDVLPEQEFHTTLPFFIGDRLYGSLMLDHDDAARATRVRRVIRAFIDQSS